ncbi:hypothetical protein [Nitratidesulfovibrio sp. SRB-5]|uniref:hypothetical protein n=1 Tax=Nitratidesulfovibrio sp. SRB-5 TaxID=2872636 RepID=UPI001024FC94|nr:hypothetical protein [Nitratidesulfovibrio sp. SRB-5]MBZ2171554.1 hypothetical protein [Nitratidesulfovibrio sp. SRB-5]RXF76396.1 hypothetical protein EKK70_12085 [Desulfovibrio sp. DS-1]
MNVFHLAPHDLLEEGAIPTTSKGMDKEDEHALCAFVEVRREADYSLYVQCFTDRPGTRGIIPAACKSGSAAWTAGDSRYLTNRVWIFTDAMRANAMGSAGAGQGGSAGQDDGTQQPEAHTTDAVSAKGIQAIAKECAEALKKARRLADYHGFGEDMEDEELD